MKTRLAIVLGSILLIATPFATAAQSEASPAPGIDTSLITQLCAASTADDAELTACVDVVEAALAVALEEASTDDAGLRDRAEAILDDTRDLLADTVDQIRGDVEAAIDEALAAVEELDLGVDVRAVIDDVVADVLAATEDIDIAAAVDGALEDLRGAIEDADLGGRVDDALAALEAELEKARDVFDAAEAWAQENADVVCPAGSVSFGTTVGIAVFTVTGVEWLGLQAFRVAEGISDRVCDDVLEE